MNKTLRHSLLAGLRGIAAGSAGFLYFVAFFCGAEHFGSWFAYPFLILTLGVSWALLEWKFGYHPEDKDGEG